MHPMHVMNAIGCVRDPISRSPHIPKAGENDLSYFFHLQGRQLGRDHIGSGPPLASAPAGAGAAAGRCVESGVKHEQRGFVVVVGGGGRERLQLAPVPGNDTV